MVRRLLRKPRVRGVLLGSAVLLLALHDLGDAAIVHNDEAREVGIVQDIVAGHWLWPRFNDELLPDKPTLFHWLAAVPCALFGFSATAVRLPSALAAAGTVWWTVEFGSWLLGPPAGLVAGVVLATCRSFFAHARGARPDPLLVLLLALALGSAYRWWREDRRRDATAALVLLALGVLAKGPVAPALFAATLGLFLLWQRDLRRLRGLLTPAGLVAFGLLGLGWYAVAWAGWGDTFVKQHLIGRYVHNLAGGLASGGAYSRRPWYYHAFFYPQHLPAIVWPWSPFVAVALWQLWRRGGLGDPRMRFLLCWAAAPVIVFTPAEWKLRYYLLPSLPPLALLVGPTLVRLLDTPVLPLRVTRASAVAAAGVAVVGVAGIVIYLGHPAILSASDQLTRDALLRALGGSRASALVLRHAARDGRGRDRLASVGRARGTRRRREPRLDGRRRARAGGSDHPPRHAGAVRARSGGAFSARPPAGVLRLDRADRGGLCGPAHPEPRAPAGSARTGPGGHCARAGLPGTRRRGPCRPAARHRHGPRRRPRARDAGAGGRHDAALSCGGAGAADHVGAAPLLHLRHHVI